MSATAWRLAEPSDAAAVVATLAAAFADDPVWGLWAFPDARDRAAMLQAYWPPFVDAGLMYDGVVMTPGAEAVAVGVPPGVHEMDEENEAALAAGAERLFGDRAPLLVGAYELFGETRAKAPPHWYLSLLATHPDHSGKGLGMRLMADMLESVDAEHLPAYLESTNPANVERYRGAGFELHGGFEVPEGPMVTTMWRPAR